MSELPSSEQRPACSKCQTPMVRYNVPHTGDKEQAWRLACSCKHSAVSEVVPSNEQLQRDLELAYQMLEANRVSRERARSVHNGVGVPSARWARLVNDEQQVSARLRTALERCRLASGLAKAQIIDEALSGAGSPNETTALPPACSAVETSRDDARDAARYRWLREHFVSGPHSQHRLEWYLPRGCPLNAEGLDENLDSELPAVEPSPAHTTEQDFQHWLSYSGMRYSFKHVATERELRIAYCAGADVAPVKAGGCPTHGMEHFFEGMCIKCGVVPAENGTGNV